MYHTLVLAPPLTSCVLRNRKAWVSQGNNNSNLKYLTTSKAILGSTKKLLTHFSPHLALSSSLDKHKHRSRPTWATLVRSRISRNGNRKEKTDKVITDLSPLSNNAICENPYKFSNQQWIAVELRLTKTSPTSFYKKHSPTSFYKKHSLLQETIQTVVNQDLKTKC